MQYLTKQYKTDCVSKRLTLETESFFKMLCWVIAQAELLAMLAAIGPSHSI